MKRPGKWIFVWDKGQKASLTLHFFRGKKSACLRATDLNKGPGMVYVQHSRCAKCLKKADVDDPYKE